MPSLRLKSIGANFKDFSVKIPIDYNVFFINNMNFNASLTFEIYGLLFIKRGVFSISHQRRNQSYCCYHHFHFYRALKKEPRRYHGSHLVTLLYVITAD